MPKKPVRCRNGLDLEGPRYDVGLRKADDPCCFANVDHADDLPAAKRIAEAVKEREGRDTVVWDRAEMEVVWPPGGFPPKPQQGPPPPKPPAPAVKRSKR